MAALAVAEEEAVIPTGTIHIQTAITTPMDTPTGMTTYGLDIVVKFDASRTLLRKEASSELDFTHASHMTLSFHTRQQHSFNR